MIFISGFFNFVTCISYTWRPIGVFLMILVVPLISQSQVQIGDDIDLIDYSNPIEYEIGGITVSGVQYLDQNVLVLLSGLKVGDRIKVPGQEITQAIKKLWDQGLFENIRISISKIQGDLIFLDIYLEERPRLSKFSFKGVKKTEADKLREDMRLVRGDVVTDNLLMRVQNTIKRYYSDKGFLNAEVDIEQVQDTTRPNNVSLVLKIDKNSRIKIYNINIYGNKDLSAQQLKRAFKETKEKGIFNPLNDAEILFFDIVKDVLHLQFMDIIGDFQVWADENMRIRLFKSSKFIEEDYQEDRKKLINKYHSLGYRDASILKDSIYPHDDKSINIDIYLNEGDKYYFRNITWVGNTKYTNEQLDQVLKIKKGDIYNRDVLETNLNFNQTGPDVSSLYLDDGYLFFSVNPVEVLVENDSIDIEIRIREGRQATVNRVSVRGNTKTNDHVIMREVRTRPGQLFSRSDIIRTIRELGQLGYFDAESITPDVVPDPEKGNVDITYAVEETSADQIELSGGWGYGRIIGTLGVSFNNFSLRNMFNKEAWKPIPSGDGQRLSLRVQSYGRGYISYSASFTEPWLGGKKPNAFSVSYYHSNYTNGLDRDHINYASFKINGLSFGLGRRLKWPDDYFTLYQGINLQRYDLHNWSRIVSEGTGTGFYNNFSYNVILGRSSITPSPTYPRGGSDISLSLKLTPPYSLFSEKDYATLDPAEKYRWIEYHKWKVKASFFQEIAEKLVMHARVKYGFLGKYNNDIGVTPFERFYLGGDGLTGYNQMDGREIIGMRGYDQPRLISPDIIQNSGVGGTAYAKYTLELRYPLSLNPMSTIYVMGFLEAGNNWVSFKDFNPFEVYRSAGVGVRIFLPMFGMLGLDWGYGFDDPLIPDVNGGGNFHFSINQSID
ncbi:MAG: POTRA domain-containing protein [Bacteroidales bacterium]